MEGFELMEVRAILLVPFFHFPHEITILEVVLVEFVEPRCCNYLWSRQIAERVEEKSIKHKRDGIAEKHRQ